MCSCMPDARSCDLGRDHLGDIEVELWVRASLK
jgi:hypothetical protein